MADLLIPIPAGMNLTGALVADSADTRWRVVRRTNGGVYWACSSVETGRPELWRPKRLDLDLRDDVSRMRVLRWLAARVGLQMDGVTEDTGEWYIATGSAGLAWLNARYLPVEWRVWALCTWNQNFKVEFEPDRGDHKVPALATLDPNDDTRLPDGTRLVDAQALAAVARQTMETTDA